MSQDYNNISIVGRLTRDPELSYTQNQKEKTTFSIANNRIGPNNSEEVNFLDVTTWGKLATVCSQYLKKGSQVVVGGRIQQDRWQDKQTGANRSKVVIVAQTVQFMTKADNGAAGSPPPPASAPGNNPPAPPPSGGFDDPGMDDEVPF